MSQSAALTSLVDATLAICPGATSALVIVFGPDGAMTTNWRASSQELAMAAARLLYLAAANDDDD